MSTEERESWKAIADRLAFRLASHAHCDEHAEDQPEMDCPFCRDRAAYLVYVAAGGTDCRLRSTGRTVTLDQLLRGES